MKSLLYHITHQALMDISCCLMLHGRGTSYLVFFSFLKLKHKHMMLVYTERDQEKSRNEFAQKLPSNNLIRIDC